MTLPIIQQVIKAEIDPFRPVPEICELIQTVIAYHQPAHEEAILLGIKDAIEKRLTQLQGGKPNGKQIRQSSTAMQDKR